MHLALLHQESDLGWERAINMPMIMRATISEQELPQEMKGTVYYEPSGNSYELKIKDWIFKKGIKVRKVNPLKSMMKDKAGNENIFVRKILLNKPQVCLIINLEALSLSLLFA